MLDKLPATRVAGALTNAAIQGRAGVPPAPGDDADRLLALTRSSGRRDARPTFARPLPAKRLAQTTTEHRIQTAAANSERGTRKAELAAAEPPAFVSGSPRPSDGRGVRGEGNSQHSTNAPQLAFVLDWQLLSGGTLSSLVLSGTNTYHVTGPVTVNGEMRIEGGTVVKFDLWNTAASLSLLGPVVCDTSEYRPAIFTGQDDNSIGTTLPISNGTPGWWAYGGGYLYFYGSAPVVLQHLRMKYSSAHAVAEGRSQHDSGVSVGSGGEAFRIEANEVSGHRVIAASVLALEPGWL
jgi:hypothetical protein